MSSLTPTAPDSKVNGEVSISSSGLEAQGTPIMPPNEADATATTDIKMDEETTQITQPEDGNNEEAIKVKFISGTQNQVDIEKGQTGSKFQPLTKEELLQYAKDPFWNKLRWGLFILFWIIWLAMLVASIIIIIYAPKCPTPEPKQWWQKSPIYEVYVKSFKDSDADGMGDLKGVTSKLDYLINLGVGSVLLSPIYKSPMDDNGYDIEDYLSVNPKFGTLQDFKDLLAAMQEKGLKLIMDFVPNHTSDRHPWFQSSIQNEDEFADYYIWREGTKETPPNNWISVFGGSAWTWNNDRGAWYLHQFKKSQPDLNLRNSKVIQKLQEAMIFWLNLGVDGFRFDAVGHMFEVEDFSNEVVVEGETYDLNNYRTLKHSKTYDLPEVLDLLSEFRGVLDRQTEEMKDKPRIMMTEAYIDDVYKYYGPNGTISHMPINFNLITAFKDRTSVSAQAIQNSIEPYLKNVQTIPNAWPNFNLGNHDNPRVSSRFGKELIDGMNMIVMLLPGTPITYYGEELGMKDVDGQVNDPRDPERSPMIWDSSPNAGFTSHSKPWLKIMDDYKGMNLEEQMKDAKSHYSIYKTLAKMRHNDAILLGKLESFVNGTVFAYARVKKGNPGVVVAVNFGSAPSVADISSIPNISEDGTILLRSKNENTHNSTTTRVNFNNLQLLPKEGVVVSFVPKF